MNELLQVAGLDGEPVEVGAGALEPLSDRLKGRVLVPGHAGFEEAVTIWNGMIRRRPALVVQPVDENDVREAVRFAGDRRLVLSIRGGGHNVAGNALAHGGVTLDMSRMSAVDVDPRRALARAGGGCLLGDVDRATQQHGLATVLGGVSRTGVAGLTLGGGFGYLSRRFGWTVDNLEAVEIVTADGELRRAAVDDHDDLFWALRGGGGNFGVVTNFTFRLHRIGPQVTGGMIVWDAEEADDVCEAYRQVAEASSDDLTLMLVMRLAPRAGFVPPQWHGQPVVVVVACHTGDPSTAADELAAIRSVGHPIVDRVGPIRYVDLQSMLDTAQPDGLYNYWKSEFLGAAPPELFRVFREQSATIASPFSHAMLFQLGGAIAGPPAGATPFGNRDAAFVFFAAGCWAPDDEDGPEHAAWARAAWGAVRPYSTGGNYTNVQMGDEDDVRLKEAYGDSLDRLSAVKARYDPDNLFRVNRNIKPAGSAG
ncbi:MAG TPA: FAD-binding oxidoreductase [Acidimicrobiales bacterium]|nr:FAD-binding oxidoreductase [Acidimicrobiales bacterium]